MSIPAKCWWDKDVGTHYREERLKDLETYHWKAKEGKYGWKCLVEWEMLFKTMNDELDTQGRADGPARGVYMQMQNEWGHDHNEDWPIVGCGCGFRPYSDGPSMTLNVKMDENEYDNIMSERLPTVLDDAFKAARHMTTSELCDGLDAVAVYKWLPIAFPQNFELKDEKTGKNIYGVAQYPIKKWEKVGRPYMSAGSWIKFAMMIGKDKPELAKLVEIAECYEDTDSDAHKFNEKNLRKFQAERVATGYKQLK